MPLVLVKRFFRCDHSPTILALFILFFSSAHAIDKCVIDNKVTYTDRDCPANSTATPFTKQVVAPDDPVAANDRYLSDKRKLQQINAQKAKEEAQQKHEAQVANQKNKLAINHQIHCNNLNLRRQLASGLQADTKQQGNQKKLKRAQLQAQHAEDNYALACKSE